jgi:predicted exporter
METYTPTGVATDRVSLADMRTAYTEAHKHYRGDANARLTAALLTMVAFVKKASWAESAPMYNPSPFTVPVELAVSGYTGIRLKRVGDLEWKLAMELAVTCAREEHL